MKTKLYKVEYLTDGTIIVRKKLITTDSLKKSIMVEMYIIQLKIVIEKSLNNNFKYGKIRLLIGKKSL